MGNFIFLCKIHYGLNNIIGFNTERFAPTDFDILNKYSKASPSFMLSRKFHSFFATCMTKSSPFNSFLNSAAFSISLSQVIC